MTNTNIIGPINTGDKFLFVTEINSVKHILDTVIVDKKLNYFWNSNYINSQGVVNSTIPFFSATISNNALIFTDNLNLNYLAVNKINNILIINSTSDNISANSNDTVWFPPTVLLSNVNYQLLANNTKINVYTNDKLTAFGSFETSFLPIVWYSQCSGNTYDIVNTLSGTVINWTCNVATPPAFCNTPTLPNGFTLLTDCQLNFEYNYCTTPNLCGKDNCNGPCSEFYYDCTNENNNFVCKFDPEKYFTETKWYENYIFLIAISITILLFVGIIITIIILYMKKK